jgi:hypothetical protein
MKVRDLIKQLLDQDLDAEVGHAYSGRFYPLRTLVPKNDPKLRLSLDSLDADVSHLDIVSLEKSK